MKLTTKGNYAISAILDLAIHSKEKHISLNEIAKRLELSENYLRQLFMELRQSNLINSYRGVGGGYYLTLHPKDINLLSIIEAVEGDVFVVPCLDEEDNNNCQRLTRCCTRTIWEKLNNSVKDKLSKLTLQELMYEYEENRSF